MTLNCGHKGIEKEPMTWKGRPVHVPDADKVSYEHGVRVRAKRALACLVLLSNNAASKLTQVSREVAIS